MAFPQRIVDIFPSRRHGRLKPQNHSQISRLTWFQKWVSAWRQRPELSSNGVVIATGISMIWMGERIFTETMSSRTCLEKRNYAIWSVLIKSRRPSAKSLKYLRVLWSRALCRILCTFSSRRQFLFSVTKLLEHHCGRRAPHFLGFISGILHQRIAFWKIRIFR